MKTIIYTVLLSLCAALLVSCGDGGGNTAPEHTGEYLDALSYNGVPMLTPTGISLELSEEDVSLIAHLVSCEAGEFSYETQVCFGAMVLNRIADPGFPPSARGVVLDSGDFSSVLSGKVTGTLPCGYTVSKKYTTALKAVREAMLQGDPTGGALYFKMADDSDPYAVLSYECGGIVFEK